MTGGDFTCKWLAAEASNGLCNCPMHEWHQSLHSFSYLVLFICNVCIITGSIALSATCQYLIYSRGRFGGFSPRRGDTLHRLGWNLAWRPLLHAKFHPNSTVPPFSYNRYLVKLECGPMPNVMVALPNIGGALCSTPQSLADAHY